MDIDRQAIERRDFPIARRGYEPAAVDAHLRALASEIEELQRERDSGGPGAEPSLATTAGTQVQSILAAAEAAASEIEQQARDGASATREQAEHDAVNTRDEAVAQARSHVAAVSQATAVLLERVGSMDGEVAALVESLHAGAGRLANDLAALDANIGELYDAASGRTVTVTHAVADQTPAQPSVPAPPPPPATPRPASGAAAPHVRAAQTSPPPLAPSESADPHVHVDPEAPPAAQPASASSATAENGDVDSARLVALNMALNGESREDAERYLAENYQLADRQKLIDEVFAAIEG